VGDFVFGGNGTYVEKGLYDGKPAWHYTDDRPEPAMFTAGGWRTLYTLFQMVGDGVTDEFRHMGPGQMIGKSFYARQHEIVPEKWRTPRDTNFFMLFQVGGVPIERRGLKALPAIERRSVEMRVEGAGGVTARNQPTNQCAF
jgi:hypothetical protein